MKSRLKDNYSFECIPPNSTTNKSIMSEEEQLFHSRKLNENEDSCNHHIFNNSSSTFFQNNEEQRNSGGEQDKEFKMIEKVEEDEIFDKEQESISKKEKSKLSLNATATEKTFISFDVSGQSIIGQMMEKEKIVVECEKEKQSLQQKISGYEFLMKKCTEELRKKQEEVDELKYEFQRAHYVCQLPQSYVEQIGSHNNSEKSCEYIDEQVFFDRQEPQYLSENNSSMNVMILTIEQQMMLNQELARREDTINKSYQIITQLIEEKKELFKQINQSLLQNSSSQSENYKLIEKIHSLCKQQENIKQELIYYEERVSQLSKENKSIKKQNRKYLEQIEQLTLSNQQKLEECHHQLEIEREQLAKKQEELIQLREEIEQAAKDKDSLTIKMKIQLENTINSIKQQQQSDNKSITDFNDHLNNTALLQLSSASTSTTLSSQIHQESSSINTQKSSILNKKESPIEKIIKNINKSILIDQLEKLANRNNIIKVITMENTELKDMNQARMNLLEKLDNSIDELKNQLKIKEDDNSNLKDEVFNLKNKVSLMQFILSASNSHFKQLSEKYDNMLNIFKEREQYLKSKEQQFNEQQDQFHLQELILASKNNKCKCNHSSLNNEESSTRTSSRMQLTQRSNSSLSSNSNKTTFDNQPKENANIFTSQSQRQLKELNNFQQENEQIERVKQQFNKRVSELEGVLKTIMCIVKGYDINKQQYRINSINLNEKPDTVKAFKILQTYKQSLKSNPNLHRYIQQISQILEILYTTNHQLMTHPSPLILK